MIPKTASSSQLNELNALEKISTEAQNLIDLRKKTLNIKDSPKSLLLENKVTFFPLKYTKNLKEHVILSKTQTTFQFIKLLLLEGCVHIEIL